VTSADTKVETVVLEDPTGRRRRRMRLLGRAVSMLFLLWLVVIVLGGIGVAPLTHAPFVHALRPTRGPPQVRALPRPRPPSPSDLLPALPAAAAAALPAPRAAVPRAHAKVAHPRGRSSLAPGHTKTTTTPASRGRSSLAPGHTKTTTTPASRGRSSLAPGHTPTVTTTRGRSSSAPGHTGTSTTTATATSTTAALHRRVRTP
jgi:hypothetical protein